MKALKVIARILLGIIFAPILIAATVLIAFAKFVSRFAMGFLKIFAILFAILGTFAFVMIFVEKQDTTWRNNAILMFVIAWLISPYGLPGLLVISIDLLSALKSWIVSSIYGFSLPGDLDID